jgi:hypothetical protein
MPMGGGFASILANCLYFAAFGPSQRECQFAVPSQG